MLQPSVLDRISEDGTSFESDVLPKLAADGQLSAYKHSGFWRPMDTLRDRSSLRKCGLEDKRPGRCGETQFIILGRTAGFAHWPHRLQGSWLSLWLVHWC